MRSYQNKKHETVTVSKEHLDTAVELKQLLQKDSPSNRCSWVLHRKLMLEEGYDDSENSEGYRQMIKAHQKSIGELPSAEKHADRVVTSKLESYKELVGEVKFEKHENQKYLRKINKGKKDIIDGVLFIDEVKEAVEGILSELDLNEMSRREMTHIENVEGRMISVISDWHIGALVDVNSNKYDFAIAEKRISQYVNKIRKLAFDNKVVDIEVVYMGDAVEHAYMRNSQAYHAEFPLSEQMVRCGKLIIEMLLELSKDFNVQYRGFAGNHDRMAGDKNSSLDNDTAMVVINGIVETFVNVYEGEGLSFAKTNHYNAKLVDFNGRNFKFVHGDLEKRGDTGKIHDHSSRDGIIYDAIVYGHFHHWMSLEVGLNKWEIRCGSIKGSDDYSEKLGLGSIPSQVAIIVSNDGDIQPYRIGLN